MQAPVSDADIQAYYDQHVDQLPCRSGIRYSIIRISKRKDDAKSGTGCAEQGREDFATLAKRVVYRISSLRVMAAIWAGWKSSPRCR